MNVMKNGTMFQKIYCRANNEDKPKENAETFLKLKRFVWPKPKKLNKNNL